MCETRRINLEDKPLKSGKAWFIKVLKKSGDTIYFASKPSGITNGVIRGMAYTPSEEREIENSSIKKIKKKRKKNLYKLVTHSDKKTLVHSYRKAGEKIIYRTVEVKLTTISLSEVDMIWVKKLSPVRVILATLGIATVLGLIYGFLTWSPLDGVNILSFQ